MNPDVAVSPQLMEGGPITTRGSHQYLSEVVKAGRDLHRSKKDDTLRRKTARLRRPADSIEMDIVDCFGSIPNGKLIKKVVERIQ